MSIQKVHTRNFYRLFILLFIKIHGNVKRNKNQQQTKPLKLMQPVY